jgi:hypothetical protein
LRVETEVEDQLQAMKAALAAQSGARVQ